MVWTPPTRPDPGIATASEVVAETLEQGGASYRTQKHAWVQQEDAQHPYYLGFTKTVRQLEPGIPVGTVGAQPPLDKGPEGTRRPRSSKDDRMPGGKANKKNVQNRSTHKETTGEDPAPLFTHGQIQSRS
jgi:hypothetical protein